MRTMIVDLPSHGYKCNMHSVIINPMTYGEMIDYDSMSSPNDKIKQLITDIELLKKDNPDIGELNYFDLDAVLTTKKMISVTDQPTITIPNIECPNEKCKFNNSISVPISQVKFGDFNEEFVNSIDSIIINNKKIKIKVPKLKDALDLATKMQVYRSRIDFKVFQTILCLDFDSHPNQVISTINSATRDEILLLEYMRYLLVGDEINLDYTCKGCGRKESVSRSAVLADMFRLLQANEELDKSKILLSKKM